MDITLAAVIGAAAAVLVGATIQGSIGFGMNLVTVPVVALVLPDALPATAVLLGIPLATAMVRHERHAVDRSGVAWIMVGRLPGTVVGAWVVATVTDSTLGVLIGAFVLLAVLASVAAPPLPVHRGTQLVAGVVSGTTGTAAGIGGPPVALLYQRHPGPTMRATLAATFLFGTILSIATLAVAGEVHGYDVGLALGLAPLTVAGSYLGRHLARMLDRGWLRPAVLAFATVSAVVVILNAR